MIASRKNTNVERFSTNLPGNYCPLQLVDGGRAIAYKGSKKGF